MSTLVRKELELKESDRFSPEQESLLQKAERVLGYTGVQIKTATTMASAIAKAKAAFAVVGLEPYTQQSVSKYQRKKVFWANLKYCFRNYSLSGTGETLQIVSTILGIVLVVVGGVMGSVCLWEDPYSAIGFHLGLCIGFPLGLLLITHAIAIQVASRFRRTVHHGWRSELLNSYREEIPEFAIAHAIALKEAEPAASFHAEFLYQEETHVPLPDPFLVMAIDGYKFYVDVWDEPEFEKRAVK